MSARSLLAPLLGALLILGVPAYVVATAYPGWDSWAIYVAACATTVAALGTLAPRGHATRRRTLVRHYEPEGR